MAKPNKSENSQGKEPKAPGPKGNGIGDPPPWPIWPSRGPDDKDCGCCEHDVRPWNNGRPPKPDKHGPWQPFMQVVFPVDPRQGPPVQGYPWWVRCKGKCQLGDCKFQYQVYYVDANTRVLNFRCECRLPPHKPAP